MGLATAATEATKGSKFAGQTMFLCVAETVADSVADCLKMRKVGNKTFDAK